MSREAGGRPIRLAPEYRSALSDAGLSTVPGSQHALLTDQVHELLTRLIVQRELPPGSKVNIGEFARRLGTSRMPVVDALNRLEMEGLIERRDRVGSFVTPLTLSDFTQIFEARSMVEEWAAPKIVDHLTTDDVRMLRDLLRQSALLLVGVDEDSFDAGRMLDLDRDFHLALVRIAANERVLAWYRSLNVHIQIGRVHAMRALARCRNVQREHERILAAFEARDITRARQAIETHLTLSYRTVADMIRAHGGI